MSVSGLERILADSLDYKQIKKSIVRGNRRTVKLNPATNNIFTQNQKIHFDFPSNHFMDTENSKFIFTAISNDSSSESGFNNFIECIINRLVFYLGNGSEVIEDIKQYNINATEKAKYKYSQDYTNTIGAIQQGIASDTNRIALAQTGTNYAVGLLASGIFNSNLKYLPLKAMSKGGDWNRSMSCDIYLEDASRCMFTGDNSVIPGYTITNCYFQLELVECPECEDKIDSDIRNGSLVLAIPFESSENWNNSIENGELGQVTFPVNFYREYFTGWRTVFIPDIVGTLSQYTWTWTKPNDLGGYQYIVKNQYYPAQQVEMSNTEFAAQMNELLKYFGKNIQTFDRSISTGLSSGNNFSTQLNSLLARGQNIIGMTPSTVVRTDFLTSPPFLNENWTVTTTTIKPAVTGFYNVSISGIPKFYTDDGTSSNVFLSVALFNGTSNLSGSTIALERIAVTAQTATASTDEIITLNFIAFLFKDITYSLNFSNTVSSDAHALIDILRPQITAFLMNPNESFETPLSENADFLIAQTFKTWYDNIDNLNAQGEYLLDGLDTYDSAQSTMRMTLNQAQTKHLSVVHYLDYIGAITISSSGVNIQK